MGPIRRVKNKSYKRVDQNGGAYLRHASASLRSPKLHSQPFDWWHDCSKRLSGNLSHSKTVVKFEAVFGMSRRTFDYICSLVKDDMLPHSYTDMRGKSLSLNDQVAIALKRLSSGESLNTVGSLFQVNQSSVGKITWRFVESMEKRALHHGCWPSTEEEMKEVKSKFEKIRGLPNCCGAVDTTHIRMTLPVAENNLWLDHENKYSMILQTIVDPLMRFRDIITGWPGALRYDVVVKSSKFSEHCVEGKKLNGKKIKLSEGVELREYIVGDASVPLLPWLLTPYQGKDLLEFQIEFNKRHYATRLVARRALARLKEMWKITQKVMWIPDKSKLPRIIHVCCLLHNIVIDLEDEAQDEIPLSYHHDQGYQQQICGSVDKSASVTRDNLALFLSGKLPA